MSQTYKVGQILFVIPTGKVGIVPVQIVEEIVKRTINGVQTSYVAKINREGGTAEVSSIKGEIFDSAQAARTALLERSHAAITKMVERAVSQSQLLYPNSQHVESSSLHEQEIIVSSSDENGDSFIVLEDGTKARVKLPDALNN